MRMNSRVFKTVEAPTEQLAPTDKVHGPRSQSTSQNIRLMSFKDLRQLQKIASEAMVGPGSYEMPESKMNKVSFGRRGEVKMEQTPGPGCYNSDATMLLKTSLSSTSFKIQGK